MHQEVKYSVGNDSKAVVLAKAFDSEYRALVKVLPPISNIQVEATDVNKNHAQLNKTVVVDENDPISIMDLLNPTTWKDKLFGESVN